MLGARKLRQKLMLNLLLIFSLGCKTSFDTLPCFHKRLSLSDFAWIMCQDSSNISCHENYNICHKLKNIFCIYYKLLLYSLYNDSINQILEKYALYGNVPAWKKTGRHDKGPLHKLFALQPIRYHLQYTPENVSKFIEI